MAPLTAGETMQAAKLRRLTVSSFPSIPALTIPVEWRLMAQLSAGEAITSARRRRLGETSTRSALLVSWPVA